ncbi:MAG: T9SS type A sorting domain-containing protein [Flavobacteriales bacterium]|nr:T9SS type A sorting domain-containing protein [Flavobacteriales bacterium]
MKAINILAIAIFSLVTSTLYCQTATSKRCNHNHLLAKTGSIDNLRSDTINIINYTISLDFNNVGSQEISGNCQIKFTPLQNNIHSISLDLLQLSVDSIQQQGTDLSFSYNDTLIITEFINAMNIGDTNTIVVYYHGQPQGDPSGWGGFYFQGAYAYNLGVGFGADPHNYGRVWHPCFDNFVERATYNITLLTPSNLRGYANGLIENEVDHGATYERTWKLNQEIPTYLACVAVGEYTHVNQNYHSNLTGEDIPMYLIAVPGDTTNFKASFINLGNAVEGFEEHYGEYMWDKVGFHLVPFNSGAMEHATSIAYPRTTADGSLSYETLMAHELSHHWWGNLVTCRTDGDMWINEGLASYSERIFLEKVYGYSSYIDDIKMNHKDVLLNAHVRDSGYFAISGVPHAITYGDHSYNKGADVAHNLRAYMGDAEFFSGLQSFLNDNAFKDVDAYDFRDHLNANTNVDVTDFFNDWVFNAGFPGFIIDSSIVSPNGSNFDIDLYIHQKQKGTNHVSSNVPLEVTFVSSNWEDTTLHIVADGEFTSTTLTISFDPEMIYLNGQDKLSEAVTGENVVITGTGTKDLSYSMFRFVTDNAPDSSLVRIEHYWVAPDPFKEPENEFAYYISEERFWKVDGIWADGFHATGRVYLTGKSGISTELDPLLVSLPGFHEDSIVLLYRENSGSLWSAVDNITIQTIGSATDGRAYVNFDNLKKGEYTFGWRKSPVKIEENTAIEWKVYPNPVTDWLNINLGKPFDPHLTLTIFNSIGQKVTETNYWSNKVNVSELPKGVYVIRISDHGLETYSSTFLKE